MTAARYDSAVGTYFLRQISLLKKIQGTLTDDLKDPLTICEVGFPIPCAQLYQANGSRARQKTRDQTLLSLGKHNLAVIKPHGAYSLAVVIVTQK